ncbi:MAG TPA: amidohydrolase family protein [Methylomirabilota bacterium]|jgi:N-acyl-D-aspartate/D-glutamate deacylase|nr:amidohydrolase family protein [Methylomirabilota bacterium]
MHDLVIDNALIVDGTGGPARMGGVAVSGGRITAVDVKLGAAAQRRIDAGGRALAPGFIDPHTHYDAQVAWDPLLTCSPWHGVTTVVTGNCGVGVAPCRPEAREVLMGDLVNVEAIPIDVMRRGIDWRWETFAEYMAAVGGRGLGINMAPLVPLTPLRHYVMGEASFERAATHAEAMRMSRLLGEALDAGAFGLSTTILANHVGHEGRPLACRLAGPHELSALCEAMRRRGRGVIEAAITSLPDRVTDAEYATLALLVGESQRPVTYLAVFARPGKPGAHEAVVERMAPLLGRDRAIPQVSCRPLRVQFTLKNPFIFATMASWAPVFNRPVAEQRALYASAAFREAWKDEMERRKMFRGQWSRITVRDAAAPAARALLGQSIADIAAARGAAPADTLLEVALADELETLFDFPVLNQDPEGVRPLVTDPRFLIGLSDGGAHVDQLCDVGYATYLLGKWVRERQALTLETAVRRLTGEVAELFAIPDRGLIAPGKIADLVLFDPDTVDDEPPEYVHDLPGGAKRLVARARGIHEVIVDGESLYRDGVHQGTTPGAVLRARTG